MARVLAIQNEDSDPPGLVAEWLAEVGVDVDVCRAFAGEPVPPQLPAQYSGLMAFGGSMDATDDAGHPWLADVRALMRDCIEHDRPVFGICLGGQLLAAAVGATVERTPVIEIGVVDVRTTPHAAADEVFAAVGDHDVPAAQWHQDWVRDLPAGATLLMSNAACPVQAFRIGSAYGVQFHPEVDAATFATWGEYADEAAARSGVDVAAAVAQVASREHDLRATWRPVFHRWGRVVLGL